MLSEYLISRLVCKQMFRSYLRNVRVSFSRIMHEQHATRVCRRSEYLIRHLVHKQYVTRDDRVLTQVETDLFLLT